MEIRKGFVRNEWGEWISLSRFDSFDIDLEESDLHVNDRMFVIKGYFNDKEEEPMIFDTGFHEMGDAQSSLDNAFRKKEED